MCVWVGGLFVLVCVSSFGLGMEVGLLLVFWVWLLKGGINRDEGDG